LQVVDHAVRVGQGRLGQRLQELGLFPGDPFDLDGPIGRPDLRVRLRNASVQHLGLTLKVIRQNFEGVRSTWARTFAMRLVALLDGFWDRKKVRAPWE